MADPKPDDAKTAAERAREALHGAERPEQGSQQHARQEPPKQDSDSSAGYDPKDLTRVPGAVGRFVDWVESDAMFPSRRLALGAAVEVVGTLGGHRVRGPTGAGTHLYTVELAPTGEGKSAPLAAVLQALDAVGAGILSAGEMRSSVGLIDTLKKQPVFLACIDEFGDFLQQLTSAKSGSNYGVDTLGALKKVFTLSYQPYISPASKEQKSVRIFAPAPSILGFSTREAFYVAIREKQTAGGLLSRFLIIDEQQPTQFNPNYKRALELPPALRHALKGLYKPRDVMMDLLDKKLEEITTIVGTWFKPEIEMQWGPGAEAVFFELVREMRKEADPLRRNLFIRVPEIAIRLATIAAYGRGSRTVDAPDVRWAQALAREGAETLHRGILEHSIDPQDFPVQCRTVIKLVRDSLTRSEDGNPFLSVRLLNRAFLPFTRRGGDLEQVLKYLIEAEQIKRYHRSTGGRPAFVVELLPD
jgi:hypothetical protein